MCGIQIFITPLQDFGKNVHCINFVCDTRHKKFSDQTISGVICNLSQGPVSWICRPKYYVSLEDQFAPKFLALKLLTEGINMHKGTCPIQLKWKVVYKLENTTNPPLRMQMVEADKYEISGPGQIAVPVKVKPEQISLKTIWINAFENPSNAKHEKILTVDEEGRIHTTSQSPANLTMDRSLSRSRSSRFNPSLNLTQRNQLVPPNRTIKEESPFKINEDIASLLAALNKKLEMDTVGRTINEPSRHSIDLGSMASSNPKGRPMLQGESSNFRSDRKLIGFKTKTISEPVYEEDEELNMQVEACLRVTNPNSIYIPIVICIEGFNNYELCAFVDSGCSVCFGKKTLFPEFMWKPATKPIQVRIADNSIMVHSEVILDLPIMLGGYP